MRFIKFWTCMLSTALTVAIATGMSIGHKGMHLAAKVLAATAQDLLRDPQLRDAIRAEFDARRGSGYEYRALLGDRLPPLDYRVNP
mgnify:CR=1 FL=1